MKNILISIFVLLSITATASVSSIRIDTITSSGKTITINPYASPDMLVLIASGGAVTLGGNVTVQYSANPTKGTKISLFIAGGFTLNGHTITILNQGFQEFMVQDIAWLATYTFIDNAGTYISEDQPFTFAPGVVQVLDGESIIDGTLPLAALASDIPLSNIDTVGRGRLLLGTASNVLSSKYFGTSGNILIGDGTDANSVAVTGDIAITSGGVTSIAAGSIVNADVNASAAIALSKLAALTASQVVTTTAGGVLTTSATLSPTLGGTGANNSAATGFQTWSAGTQSVGAITDVRGLDNLSFVTANQGTYYLYFPFAATATNINCRVTSAVSGTDDGEITVANNSGTVMTGSSLSAGVLTIAASAVFGTGYSSTLTTNNTFTAGQSMQLTTAKTTTGGVMHCDVTYTRTN